ATNRTLPGTRKNSVTQTSCPVVHQRRSISRPATRYSPVIRGMTVSASSGIAIRGKRSGHFRVPGALGTCTVSHELAIHDNVNQLRGGSVPQKVGQRRLDGREHVVTVTGHGLQQPSRPPVSQIRPKLLDQRLLECLA